MVSLFASVTSDEAVVSIACADGHASAVVAMAVATSGVASETSATPRERRRSAAISVGAVHSSSTSSLHVSRRHRGSNRPITCVGPRGVEYDRLAELQQAPGAIQQFAVGGGGRLRTVEALTKTCPGAFGMADPRKILAHLVGAENAPSEPVGETRSERRLPGPREPADEYERDLPPLEMVTRDAQQKRSLTGRGVVTLRGPEARDHRPDVGAKPM